MPDNSVYQLLKAILEKQTQSLFTSYPESSLNSLITRPSIETQMFSSLSIIYSEYMTCL